MPPTARFIKHPPASPSPIPVTMNRADVPPTADQALWVVIRNSAEALSFENYAAFIEPIMCGAIPTRAHRGVSLSSTGRSS